MCTDVFPCSPYQTCLACLVGYQNGSARSRTTLTGAYGPERRGDDAGAVLAGLGWPGAAQASPLLSEMLKSRLITKRESSRPRLGAQLRGQHAAWGQPRAAAAVAAGCDSWRGYNMGVEGGGDMKMAKEPAWLGLKFVQ